MFCPNCKDEYREGYTHCAQCGCPLVESLPARPEPVSDGDWNPVFLCEAADDFEAELMLAKLRAEGIYAMKRYRGSDGYAKIVLGRTLLGVEILVATENLREAREILRS